MRIRRLRFGCDMQPYVADRRDGTTIRQAKETTEMIAGSGGWVTTYLVEQNGKLRARVPAWMVIAEYEPEEGAGG